MKVHVPVRLKANGQRYREWTHASVEVREVAESEAPVVVTMPGASIYSRGAPHDAWRLFEGALWKMSSGRNTGESRRLAGEERAGRDRHDTYGSFGHPLVSTAPQLKQEFTSRVNGYSCEIDQVPAATIERLAQLAERTILVGDVYHQKSSGPLIRLTRMRLWPEPPTFRVAWSYAGVSKVSLDPYDRACLFAPQELVAMSEIVETLSEGRTSAREIRRNLKNREAPTWTQKLDAPVYDSCANAVEAAAAKALTGLRTSRMKDLSAGDVSWFQAVRDAYLERWPAANQIVSASIDVAWIHEMDEIGFPPPGRLGGLMHDMPQRLIETFPYDDRFGFELLRERLKRDPRLTWERDMIAGDADAVADLRF